MEQIETQNTFVASYDIMGFREHTNSESNEIVLKKLLNTFNNVRLYSDKLKNVIDANLKVIISKLSNEQDGILKFFIDFFLNTVFASIEDVVRYELQADNIIVWIDKNHDSVKNYNSIISKSFKSFESNKAYEIFHKIQEEILVYYFFSWNVGVISSFLIETNWFLRGAINYGEITFLKEPKLIAGKAVIDAHTIAENQNSFTTLICDDLNTKLPDYEFSSTLISKLFIETLCCFKNVKNRTQFNHILSPFSITFLFNEEIQTRYETTEKFLKKLFDSLCINSSENLFSLNLFKPKATLSEFKLLKENLGEKDKKTYEKWLNTVMIYQDFLDNKDLLSSL